MKELFGLKSFQHILFLLFFLGVMIGVIVTLYFINPDKFRFSLLIPLLPALFLISRGLHKNGKLFFMDLKLMTAKS